MAIDDPLDASRERVAAEKRAESPLSRLIPHLAGLGAIIPASLLPMSELAKSALAAAGLWVSRTEADRRQYLMDCLGEEVRRLRTKLENLDEAHRTFVHDEFVPLVVDGLQKAEQTRSYNRIERIAAILTHALDVGPSKSADTAEEMMRIAMVLSDDDVRVLRSLYEGQKVDYNSVLGKTGHEQANDYWRLIGTIQGVNVTPALTVLRSYSAGELQGICATLQSFGLVAQFERNQFKVAPGVTPFGILAKAVSFVEYISKGGSSVASSAKS